MKKKIIIYKDTKLQRNQDQIFSLIDDEVVMLSIKHGEYLNLNHPASFIWEKLENPCSLGELTDLLCGTYNVDRKECIKDTLEFITDFAEKGIIQIIPK